MIAFEHNIHASFKLRVNIHTASVAAYNKWVEPYMSLSKDSYKLDKWIWTKADSDNLPQYQGHVGECATHWGWIYNAESN